MGTFGIQKIQNKRRICTMIFIERRGGNGTIVDFLYDFNKT